MKKLLCLFCLLFIITPTGFSYESYYNTYTEYELNFIDTENLRKLYKKSKGIQNLLMKENFWKSIINSDVRSAIIAKSHVPKNIVIRNDLQDDSEKTGITYFDLSTYKIRQRVESGELPRDARLVLPNPFQIYNAFTINLSDTRLQKTDGVGWTNTLINLHLNNNEITSLSQDIHTIGTFLKTFEVRNNRINIPFEKVGRQKTNVIFNLTNLERLDISNNHIGGTVPGMFYHLRDTNYIDISCNGFTGNLFGDEENLDKKTALKIRENNGTFIATAKTCLPGKKHNKFTNQKEMEALGIEFGKKVHEPVDGTRKLQPKANPYSNKVSLKIKQIIARYIVKFEKKLQNKNNQEIVQIKNQEFERIKKVAKKYKPISEIDMNMLKYLFVELKNL